jgi:DNA helicase II / ATP-dependent DNA helicase PcrA
MAKRRWALPNIKDLSKDQERVRLLPKEGCHLIVGGPGTGKSVIALLRARRHHRASATQSSGPQEYVFLVFNRLLLEASRELMDGKVHAQPWIAWFKGVFRSALKRPCPILNDQPFALDWTSIGDAIAAATGLPVPGTPFLIIDEGQDMPPPFYQALEELGFEHFFVVADQNQQITKQRSTVRDIANALAIDPRDCIELTDNYRNAYAVARLALAFCIEDPASPCTKLPSPERSARTPVLADYGPGCQWDFDEAVVRILKAADRDPARLFGIITPDNETRLRWLHALGHQPVELDHGHPRICTYASGDDQGDHRFAEGGLFVINAQSAKGLEFDFVILADIERFRCRPEDKDQMDDMRRRFYVMVSRARERVVMLRQADRPCPCEAILPTDQDVLRRWR